MKEDLKAEYEGAEEICVGSAFHMNGAFIKNEKHKVFTQDDMHCNELALQ